MDHLVVGPVPGVGAVVLIIVRERAAGAGKLNGAAGMVHEVAAKRPLVIDGRGSRVFIRRRRGCDRLLAAKKAVLWLYEIAARKQPILTPKL
jgi:hypothetical protein